MTPDDREVLRAAESMKLFERDGMIHYGKWEQWWRVRYSPEADKLLAEFRAAHP